MITQVSQTVFVADSSSRLPASTTLIRAIKLFHTCTRFIKNNKEIYICDLVAFNYTDGNYYCSNPNCGAILPFEDVVSDGEETGWEGHA